MAVLPRPSSPRKGKEEGKAAVSVPSKQNTNTTAPAAVLSATPAIANTNGTTVNSIQIANASIARASDQLFGYANFSSENGTFEENSTFKWIKRTLYQPQNCSVDEFVVCEMVRL